MLSDLTALWLKNPRELAGFIAITLIVFSAIFLFLRDRSLRKHLADLQPDRRLLFLLHRSQLRDYSLIFGMVLISSLFIWILPDAPPRHAPQSEPTAECTTPAINPDEAAKLPPSDPNAMIDLFATDQSWYPSNSTLDDLKTRYENALIGSYVLHHCKRTTQSEIDTILKALRDDIMRFQSDPQNPPLDAQALYASIVSAAEGSYEMVYRRTDCNSPQTAMLEEQFAHFVLSYQGHELSEKQQETTEKTTKKPTKP